MASNTEESAKVSLLSVDELGSILKLVTDPDDRKSFSQVCKQWSKVEGLNRSSLRLLQSDLLRRVLPRCPNLITFQTQEPLSDADLEFLAQTCPRLQVINLSICDNESKVQDLVSDGVCALANQCPNITRLLLRRRLKAGVASVIKLLPNLTHLDLGLCHKVEDNDIEAIGSAASSIAYLNLESCVCITDRGLGFLSHALFSKTLKTLVLAKCSKITDSGVSVLQNMCCLEHLNLANHGAKITDVGGLAISEIKTLKKLNLSGLMSLTDQTVVALAQNCLNLEVLDLSDCQRVTRAGLRAFSSHTCLNSLVLHYCFKFFGSDLEHLVLECPTLKCIVVDEYVGRQILPEMQESTRRCVRYKFICDWSFKDLENLR
ncbi:putative leucine-rich repeat domain, L domain-containing protein [Rosa chinensis]|uniref:Putative leucine-rich repeat domain, L domain-containing protein n=1 Tax=Rosa chinensis TaxID=74649 RepID=A0A2P6S1Q3_ROSCH|nr:F-box/LRR-repeat protein 2 [Rosa chinensis]PRQ52612.1 putative leucine-rich repeat domain, L domain-containing protein [Rosa chinensis]